MTMISPQQLFRVFYLVVALFLGTIRITADAFQQRPSKNSQHWRSVPKQQQQPQPQQQRQRCSSTSTEKWITTTEEESKQAVTNHKDYDYSTIGSLLLSSFQVPSADYHKKQGITIQRYQQNRKKEHRQPSSATTTAALSSSASSTAVAAAEVVASSSSSVVPWDKLTEIAFIGEIMEGKVIAFNRGGAIVLLFYHDGEKRSTSAIGEKNDDDEVTKEGVTAFLPNSHFSGLRHPGAVERDNNMTHLIGEVLPVKIIDLNVDTNKLVVSHREALKGLVSIGDVVTGTVTAIQPYGAFVQFCCCGDAVGTTITGLLHKSNISRNGWQSGEFVLNPSLQVGSQVRCMINEYDKYNGRISLSTKALDAKVDDDFLCDLNPSVFDHHHRHADEETEIVYNSRMITELERQFVSNQVLPVTEEQSSSFSATLLTTVMSHHSRASNRGKNHKQQQQQQQRMIKKYRP